MGNGIETEHHIIPRSRGGEDTIDNVMMVKKKLHDKFHSLFFNRTPVEILDFLVQVFWKGRIEYLEEYLLQRKERESVKILHPSATRKDTKITDNGGGFYAEQSRG